jgi:ribokinase
VDSPRIVVIGSLNMDFVVSVERLPAPGETVLGGAFRMIPGGKGANQAYAAARLGGRVAMAGRVGYDLFGDQLKAGLAAAGVEISEIHATRSEPTGVALIWVDRAGQNSIVVASGANGTLTLAEEAARRLFQGAGIALFQLETPLATVAAALAAARAEGVRTILDPAPAQPLPSELLSRVDLLTPNESEALILLGQPPGRIPADQRPAVARALRARGSDTVILKLGDEGCFVASAGGEWHLPAFAVTAVDTTAAGDTFNAALAVALAAGEPLEAAARFANAAAAVSVTRAGAQSSAPSRPEVEALLRQSPAS